MKGAQTEVSTVDPWLRELVLTLAAVAVEDVLAREGGESEHVLSPKAPSPRAGAAARTESPTASPSTSVAPNWKLLTSNE